MRIAYIVPALIQAGNVCVARDLAELMVKHGHSCDVYYFDDKPSAYDFPCPTIRIRYSEEIPFEKYDIIHTHALRPDIYAFIKVPRNCNAHMVCTIHNYVFEDAISDHGPIVGFVEGIVNQLVRYRCERFLVLTKAHYDYYTKWYSNRKLEVVYNTRVLNKSLDILEEDKTFFSTIRSNFTTICASICRITGRKGLDQIIKAMPNVSNQTCYVIIGDGPEVTHLKELVNTYGLENRVFFLGNRQNGYLYMPFIDVFCIPSHSEGFPLAMLEAASYGKAMVSSDLPVFKEVFTEEECVICQENDINSMADGIERASKNRDMLGKNAFARFTRDYSPESFYQKHVKIYNELIK